MTDVRLDTIPGCVKELTECNRETAEFAHEWAQQAGELKMLEERYKRLKVSALRGTKGKNADERAVVAQVAIEQVAPNLLDDIEGLVGKVETHKVLFKTIERRASNVQSILALHREARRTEDYVVAQRGFDEP